MTIAKSDRGFETDPVRELEQEPEPNHQVKDTVCGGHLHRRHRHPARHRPQQPQRHQLLLGAPSHLLRNVGGIIANGIPSGRAIVTISGTDKGFQSVRCGVWTRISG